MKVNMPVTDREVMMKEGTILVTETDPKGIITKANEAFIEISGFSEKELIGSNHNLVRHPDMPQEVFADLWKTIKKGNPWVVIILIPINYHSNTITSIPTPDRVNERDTIYFR